MLRNLSLLAAGVAMTLTAAIAPASARDDGYYGYGEPYYAGYDSSCEDEFGKEALIGTAIGALLGGVTGNQFGKGSGNDAATVVGALIGGFAGNYLTRQIRCDDRPYAQDTYYDAYQYGSNGRQYEWRNPRSGNYGYVTPTSWYENGRGDDCREFRQTIYVDGRRETATGTACRNANGTWRIVQ